MRRFTLLLTHKNSSDHGSILCILLFSHPKWRRCCVKTIECRKIGNKRLSSKIGKILVGGMYLSWTENVVSPFAAAYGCIVFVLLKIVVKPANFGCLHLYDDHVSVWV